MNVRTKALAILILVSFIAGCSTSQSNIAPSDEGAIETSSANDADTGDVANVSDDTKQEAVINLATNGEDIPLVDVTSEGNNTTSDEIAKADHQLTDQKAVAQTGSAVDVAADNSSNAVASNADVSDTLAISKVDFKATAGAYAQVTVSLSSEAAYVLEQTTATEYVLRIPGAKISEQAKTSQIAPQGTKGIRSVRTMQAGNEAEIRMFVEAQTVLSAEKSGNSVIIAYVPAGSAQARAQLAAPEKPKGSKDGASKKGADKTAAKAEDVGDGLRSADGSKVYTGRLISLDLQETDIDNALRIIAEVSGLNIIASEDVQGKVTLRLIEVPWDQALDVILKTNGLDQVLEGNVVRIAPVEKLRAEREALLQAKQAAEALEDLEVKYVAVSYADAKELQEQVQSVLTERGTVTSDERTNQLIVRDISKGVQAGLELIAKLDKRTPQILLETQIVEATRGIFRSLGFQWNYRYNSGPEYGNATGMNFPNSIGFGGDDQTGWASNFPASGENPGTIGAILQSADGSQFLAARLTALEQDGMAKVISRPQIATVNNKQAVIESKETVRVRMPSSGTSVATGQGASASGGGSDAFEEISVGIILSVTPQASPDMYVLMDVDAKSSTFGSRTVDDIPSTIDRHATSSVLVKSGQTFALGGVYRINDRENEEGWPFLKNIPVLGYLFRRDSLEKGNEELIFFLTPHIVEGSFGDATDVIKK